VTEQARRTACVPIDMRSLALKPACAVWSWVETAYSTSAARTQAVRHLKVPEQDIINIALHLQSRLVPLIPLELQRMSKYHLYLERQERIRGTYRGN
jgi:hypothetical protein